MPMSDTTGDESPSAADTRPAVTRGVEPEQCLVFTISGEWGHFRRVDGNIVKQTYRIMPRTTVAGLCAAILGLPRNSYYDLFAPESSALAIEPLTPLRTMNIPTNALSTATEEMKKVGHWSWSINATMVKPAVKNRQQHNYETLVDPAYRIYLWLDDRTNYRELRSHLEESTSVYSPSLGLSEYLADVTFEGECGVTHTAGQDHGAVNVTSAVPQGTRYIAPTPGVQYGTETSPGFMEQVPGTAYSRRTTGFIDWTYPKQADDLRVTEETPISAVDGFDPVVFV